MTQITVYGLHRSSLIMGVHPGCPVCSIVAASLVAVETDVGETISAAKVAFVCGLWSVGVVALLSAGPLSYFCIHQLLFPCLFRVLLHVMRSDAKSSQDSVLMSSAFMSLLQTALWRSCGRPLDLLPDANSP